ncbi:hypothetical protein I6N96_01125 [Enterococcus sp. BWM-S5]|uniref:Prevent-host-death protein n=1 Tax=Enterococcus larvae TaxID=2794352 RepID=A0ABS4CEQ4_9ENTE|nr:hypothetical protein [Enterococcus larvae]MBP1044863.1 hypothetical protein [Enterococcus larvae]
MEILITKVKQYNGPLRHVVSVDGVPVAVTKRRGRAEKLSAYLQGYQVDISDRSVERALSVLRED